MCFAKFRVKGPHWYRDKYTVGEELELIMETYNVVSKYKRKTIEITKGLEKRRQKLEKKKDAHRCESSILDIFLMRGGVSVNIQMEIFKSDFIKTENIKLLQRNCECQEETKRSNVHTFFMEQNVIKSLKKTKEGNVKMN